MVIFDTTFCSVILKINIANLLSILAVIVTICLAICTSVAAMRDNMLLVVWLNLKSIKY